VAAGRRAQDKWSNVEAAAFYRRALDVASAAGGVRPTEVAGVWEALGDALRLTGDFDDAARAFASSRRLLPKEGPQQVLLMRKEGDLREHMGKYSDALRWYGRGLKAAELLEDEALRTHHRIRFRLAHAEVRFRQGAFKASIRRCREVVDEALEAGDLQSLAPAYLLLHLVYTLLGSPDRVAFRGLALPIYEELGDLKGQATVLGNLGVEAYYEGDWTKALDLYERSRALSERIGDVSKVAMQTNNIAEIRSDQGHMEDAERMFLEVERVCRPAGQRLLATIARANLGRAAARAGRLDEAEELLSAALEDFRDIHSTSFVLETEMRLAELAVLRGDSAAEALERTRAVLEHAEDSAEMAALRASTLRLRAAAQLQLGEADTAAADLDESAEVARRADALYEVALALDLRASVDGDPEALAESGELLQRLGVERVARPPLPAAPSTPS
jgi:tetratricopeptide (TPR) repeat protein